MTILEEAQQITEGARRRDYGRPLINHLRIALEWSRLTKSVITPDRVVEMMIALKWERHTNSPKFDNLLDIIGYTACLDDMANQIMGMVTVDARTPTYTEALLHLRRMSVDEMKVMLRTLDAEDVSMCGVVEG